jgi:hypothetical protein
MAPSPSPLPASPGPAAAEPPPAPFRRPIVIDEKPTREGQKTRLFRADVLAAIAAPALYDLGATSKENTLRPVLLAYAATDQESRAFTANLRSGRPAIEEGSHSFKLKFEIPRSAAFRFDTHSHEGATLTLAYLPSAFALQPGTDAAEPGAIKFLCIPPTWWVDREAATLSDHHLSSHLHGTALNAPSQDAICQGGGAFAFDPPEAREAAIAAYFVAYLDQRSPLPIANDPRFHLELFRAARATDWCHEPGTDPRQIDQLYAQGYAALGFERPLLVSTNHASFSAFLAEQTAKHLPKEETVTHGTPRVPGPRRLLPDPAGAPAQLGLFG